MKFRFLDFELDETLFELRFGGEVVATQARVFAMIAYLLHHRDRVVSKQELIRELWRAQAISDTAISQVVMLARKALRDEGDSQRIIKTVRGRGFRFIASVDPVTAGSVPPPAPAAQVSPPSRTTPVPPEHSLAPGRATVIGRDTELEALLQRLAALREGRGGLVLIEGEPGIGKTTLATEFAAQASAQGVDVEWGRAWEEGGAPPFWPWVQVLRGLLATEGEARLRICMGRAAPELFALLPELTADASTEVDVDRARAHFRLFDAMAAFLRRASGRDPAADGGRRPRLFILDDLHAVDEASVQMLRFLAPELEGAGVLIVGTFRDLELQRQPVLAQLASSCTESQRVRLQSLDQTQVTRWLTHRLGRVPSELLARCLHEASAGNPLLLGELSRRIERDQTESVAELRALASEPLPERILRAVRSHLSELPANTLAVLSAASALGREFALSVLAPLRGCSEPELLEQLAPALARGVVQRGPNADRLIFSHAMVCHAVYGAMAPAVRIELHRNIAELLEHTHTCERAPLYEIAHHYALAAAGGCRPQALHYARRAALRAADMSAFEVSAELYDRCVHLAEAEHDAASPEILHELLCSAGEAWYRVGQLEHARARYDRAAELARLVNHPERHGQATLSSATVMRGVVLYDGGRQDKLRAALELLPPDDSALRAGLLAVSAITLRGGTAAERDARSREGIEMARRINDDQALQWLLNTRHLALWGAAHPRDMLALTDEMLALAKKTGDRDLLMDTLLWRMSDYTELGDIPNMRRVREMFRYEVERSNSPWHRYMLLSFDAFEAHTDGDFTRSRECSERAWQWGLRLREPSADGFFAVRELFLQIDEGLVHGDRQRSAAQHLHEPPSCVPAEYRPLWALSWAITEKSVDADRAVTQLLAHESSRLLLDAMRRPLLSVMARVSAVLGDAQQAARLYTLLLPDDGLHSHLQAGVYLGPVSYYLGILAVTMAQPAAAEKHLERALSECESLLPWFTRAQYALGSVWAREGRKRERGIELLREAQASSAKLGMADLREAARAELDRYGATGSVLHRAPQA